VLYFRQRSVNFRCDDIRRLVTAINEIESSVNLPAPAVQMTRRPAASPQRGTQVDLRVTVLGKHQGGGWGGSDGGGRGTGGEANPAEHVQAAKAATGASTYFFPLAYNDDQIEIVMRLDQPDVCGVVVQGPPGTGKSHTIANIVAHYMATGRRVLVSAREAEALSAIRDKLPGTLRDLAISVIHSDREGSRGLEQAVDILATQVKQIDIAAYETRRLEFEESLSRTRANLAETDARIAAYADLNLTAVSFRGEQLMPMELAARVEAERAEHAWFRDRPTHPARIGDQDIADAARIRADLGADLTYTSASLPDHSALPDVASLMAAHAAIAADRQADAQAAAGYLPYVSFGRQAGAEEARALHIWLSEIAAWSDELPEGDPWLAELYGLILGAKAVHDMVRQGIVTLCREWAELCIEGRAFVLRGIELGRVAVSDPPFDAALEALATGKKPFGILSFAKSTLKQQIDAVQLDGSPPVDAAGWSVIRAYRAWRRRAHAFTGRWSSAARAVGLRELVGEWEQVEGDIIRLGSFVERVHGFHAEATKQTDVMMALFPHGVDAVRVIAHREMDTAIRALTAALGKAGSAEARDVRCRIEELGGVALTPFHTAAADIARALGEQDVAPLEIAEGWQAILGEAARLEVLGPKRQRLEEIARAVASSGAPAWATALLTEIPDRADIWTPKGWKASWEWAVAEAHVSRLADRGALAVLSEQRLLLEQRQRELLGKIVEIRTFIGLKQGISAPIASALTKFAMKVRQLGAGTGKSAERHRRAIRDATLEAAAAVPCWILPEWRVAEQLPSELGMFDLVIIDEASQSDITALPTLMRGRKLLVVGDDKQVSPSAVGMEDRTVVQLRETFLRGMDLAHYLEPTTSLYDLASMQFPGEVIMLREHFRCVEPIISFSSRFYPKALIPLRVPTASERLDPPLVDIYLPGGRKVRDINAAEAVAIVEEIARLAAMPEFTKRSFGVISLIGDKQAKYIHDRLVKDVGTEVMARHRIMCGNASTFQGQERDVIFLSMVACESTARSQTARLLEQRYNVAMSRARDRMYLVRSVASSMLSAKDLKAAVIEHFHNPMGGVPAARPKDVLEACDSGFEREVGGRLLDMGYRLRPQVQVGAYRIDFVIEGDGSKRLAVELDGDRYHGPERWAADLYRQRSLERMGWVFWRCWGSHWLADREGCFADLLGVLDRLAIKPVGGDYSPQEWTEHRIIDSGTSSAVTEPRLVAGTGATDAITTSPQADAQPAHIPLPLLDKTAQGMPGGSLDVSAVVEPGDIVIVRFADDNRIRRFKLSQERNDPDGGVVHIGQPIGEALLGNGIEEEVDLVVEGHTRTVVIEKITKAA
jgi:very-short-patch-repair endonuclease